MWPLHAYWSAFSSKKLFIMLLQNLQIILINALRKAKNKYADKYGNIHFSDLSIDKKPNVAVLSSFKPAEESALPQITDSVVSL